MIKDLKLSDLVVLSFIAIAAFLGLLHIVFGMGSVVEAMSTSTAAAWIQAIGAIAAIGIAIWVANRTERTSERNAEIASKHFIAMAEAAIGGLYVASGGSKNEEGYVQTKRFTAELKEVQLIGQGIQLGQLSQSLCRQVLTARTTVGRFVELGF